MKTIKIVPDYLNGQPYEHLYAKERLVEWFNGWYFHGILETDLGYDKGDFLDLPEEYIVEQQVYDNKVFKCSNLNGEFKCEIEGIPYECVGYFYTVEENGRKMQRGYVCKLTDFDARQDAKRHYDKKDTWI
jgi:hypothetical protein